MLACKLPQLNNMHVCIRIFLLKLCITNPPPSNKFKSFKFLQNYHPKINDSYKLNTK